MSVKLDTPLVSVDWLYNHLETDKLIVLDCSMPNVLDASVITKNKLCIKGAVFFDIKNVFSDQETSFPNTVLTPTSFQEQAQKLGIRKDSLIVCYDTLGIYSSPRVWWMFQLMGFKNIAVLDGGLPAWKAKKYPVENKFKRVLKKGDFKVQYQSEKIKTTLAVFKTLELAKSAIIDARSNGRFYGTELEPRKGVKSGHIPNSISIPFEEVLREGKMKTKKELVYIFKNFTSTDEIICTCGSGITAAILFLGATLAGIENISLYDGSWSVWGSTTNLPIAL